jgi:hypothetical protein
VTPSERRRTRWDSCAFDATTPDAPGYDTGTCSWQHDFTGEKLHLAALRDAGRWLGEALGWRIAVTWPDAPVLQHIDIRRAAALPPGAPACQSTGASAR